MSQQYPAYITVEKKVGETPLVVVERLRESLAIPASVPMAYAGRLDPMASGKLLVLIGDECKRQKEYHSFDKEYVVEVLLGIFSDTGDVLGICHPHNVPRVALSTIRPILKSLVGNCTLSYPHFSSRTVHGKPLHVWALEKRLHEITIPTKQSRLYRIQLHDIRMVSPEEVLHTVREKIETIPPVTDTRKALGADFRRDDVRASWKKTFESIHSTNFPVLTLTITASSGSYMRSLAEVIGEKMGTKGIAYSIHRTKIGHYFPLFGACGIWTKSL